MIGNLTDNGAKLKRIFIEPKLPEDLSPLSDLAHNLWWSWSHDAIDLFKRIDEDRFVELNYNPVALLEGLEYDKAKELQEDKQFISAMNKVYKDFQSYMKTPLKTTDPHIAYFCMEYGLMQSLRLYSGGLGILAGDYLKEMSDLAMNFSAVGLLYRYGYFQQEISLHGDQVHHLNPAKFTQLPLLPARNSEGEWIKIHVNLAGKTIWAKVWELQVGRIKLYLLDTDIDDNRWEDRSLTHQLYGGDNEHRLRQEILLGIGGVRAMKALGLNPDLYHLNEGHAAFLGLERLKNYMSDKNLSFEESLEVVRSTQLFTTHTPVPAGHDAFPESLLKEYMMEYTFSLDISWEDLVAMGRKHADDSMENFSMSHLAIRTSQEVNGVSRLHGDVSRRMFNDLFPGYNHSELYMGHVTNSVHFPTWIAREWLDLYTNTFGKEFLTDQTNHDHWAKINDVPDKDIVGIRRALKKRLLDWVKQSLKDNLTRRGENPRTVFEILNNITDDALVIGFARRFATYKRATLLFTNPERLEEIVNNSDRPVIFLFAGKAHPADEPGQNLIRTIYRLSSDPRFKGRIIFLENYSMEIAKLLVQGVDVWLNNPTRPKEASGTSGMKAVLNGVMNFSVLDGWWVEGYKPGAGWALPEESNYEDDDLQNELDAETIYNILEHEIIPSYYDQDKNGVSSSWVSHIKKTIAEIAPEFVMTRMVNDYQERFYSKLWERSVKLKKDRFEPLQDLLQWKNRVERAWDSIELVELQAPDTFNYALPLGEHFPASVSLKLYGLNAEDIGVELAFFYRVSEKELELVRTHPLELSNEDELIATYACDIQPNASGVYEYGFRIFPKHPLLPHRQDFTLVRWL